MTSSHRSSCTSTVAATCFCVEHTNPPGADVLEGYLQSPCHSRWSVSRLTQTTCALRFCTRCCNVSQEREVPVRIERLAKVSKGIPARWATKGQKPTLQSLWRAGFLSRFSFVAVRYVLRGWPYPAASNFDVALWRRFALESKYFSETS